MAGKLTASLAPMTCLPPRQRADLDGRGSGCHHDGSRAVDLHEGAVVSSDLHGTGRGHAGLAFDQGHTIGFEKLTNPARELVDHAVFPALHARSIHLDSLDQQAHGRPMNRPFIRMRHGNQCLRRMHPQFRLRSHIFFFDAGHFKPS